MHSYHPRESQMTWKGAVYSIHWCNDYDVTSSALNKLEKRRHNLTAQRARRDLWCTAPAAAAVTALPKHHIAPILHAHNTVHVERLPRAAAAVHRAIGVRLGHHQLISRLASCGGVDDMERLAGCSLVDSMQRDLELLPLCIGEGIGEGIGRLGFGLAGGGLGMGG